MNQISMKADSLATASSTIFKAGRQPAFSLSGAEETFVAAPGSWKPDPAPSDPKLLKKPSMLVMHASGDGTRRSSVAPGAMWPTGTGVTGLSNRFREATPPELRDLAPTGMKLPVEAGYNINAPTNDARRAAGDIRRISSVNFGVLSGSLLNAYVTGKGRDYELSKSDTKKLLERLPDSAELAPTAARAFMQRNAEQIRHEIQKHIARTGETSGEFRSATEWMTTFDPNYLNSLGRFSAKLLYDLKYTQKRDGSIEISGVAAMAIQDLYDFADKVSSTPIPVGLLPTEFTSRPNHLDWDGYLTDAALATLQKEGLASPFYVYGVSDPVRMEMTLRPGDEGMWRFRR